MSSWCSWYWCCLSSLNTSWGTRGLFASLFFFFFICSIRHIYQYLFSSWCHKTAMIWATTWQSQQNGCAPSEDSDQPGRPPSLIRVFAVRMKKTWVLSYPLSAQRRLWSDWADARLICLRWAHSHFVGFVMSRLIYNCGCSCASPLLVFRDARE